MNSEVQVEIEDWFRAGASDFDMGILLLGKVLPTNGFYVNNIRRKGATRGLETIKYELGRKRVPVKNRVLLPVAKIKSEVDAGGAVGDGVAERIAENVGGRDEEQVKARVVIRERFPFLGKADCPNELKILVSDMLTAHSRYMDGHNKLYHVAGKSNEACFLVAEEVVENYLNNRLIWDELEYYGRNGKLLGVHPVFYRKQREEEIEGLEPTGLMKLYRNLPRSINYYKNLIEKDVGSDDLKKRKERMDWLRWEYQIVKRLLHITDERVRASKAGRKGRKVKGKGKRR